MLTDTERCHESPQHPFTAGTMREISAPILKSVDDREYINQETITIS